MVHLKFELMGVSSADNEISFQLSNPNPVEQHNLCTSTTASTATAAAAK